MDGPGWFHFIDATGDCWQWTGCRDRLGYGRLESYFGPSPTRLAHRAVWEILVGPIPDGLEIDHRCRNTSCVNPDHLEPVTHHENVRRGVMHWQRRAAAPTCAKGHPWTSENTGCDHRGRRYCRSCKRQRQARNRRHLADAVRPT